MNTPNCTSARTNAKFAQVKTYGELRDLLPNTGKRKVPGIMKLREAATVVLCAKTESGLLEVYDNGFYTYTENGYTTVYAVDRCAILKWYSCTGETFSSKDTDLSDLPWTMPLEISGSNRLEHNSDSRLETKCELYLDAPASENSIQFSVLPEHERSASLEDELHFRMAQKSLLSESFANLTPDQKELIRVVFMENHTQEEAATILGINQSNVSRRIATIKRLLQKKLKKVQEGTAYFG